MAELRKLDLTERELVRLARRAGRGWARTGTVLRVIIRPERDARVAQALRYARKRRRATGAPAPAETGES